MSLDFSSPYFQEILSIDKEYFKIIKNFDTSFIVPQNLEEEKEIFLKK